MNKILSEYGVSDATLTQDEKAFLHQNGYLNLGILLSDDQVNQINKRLEAISSEEGNKSGSELFDSKYIRHPKEEGADRLADLVNKGSVFDVFYNHPRVLSAINEVLGDSFKLSSLNYRAAKPGMGLQKLHVDWHEAVSPSDFKVCNSIWLLDDFSKANGATRIVPGTHLTGELPQEVLSDASAPHPDEVIINAPAGSVFIFNSHTWHGGTTNHTDKPRRSIHSYFCRRDQPQQIDQKRYIKQETLDRVGASGKWILDV